MTRYSVGGGRYRPELNLDEEEDDDNSSSSPAAEERRPLKGIERLQTTLVLLDPLPTISDDTETAERRSVTAGRSGTLQGKEPKEAEEEVGEAEAEEEEEDTEKKEEVAGVAANSRAVIRPRVEFVGLSDPDDDSQLTDDGENREPAQSEGDEGEGGGGGGGKGERGRKKSRLTAMVGRASVAAGTALAEAAAGHRVTMGDGRLRHPRLSLLGKPLNYHAYRRDARFRQMTKIQTTVYNFLERPKDWREISYHLLV